MDKEGNAWFAGNIRGKNNAITINGVRLERFENEDNGVPVINTGNLYSSYISTSNLYVDGYIQLSNILNLSCVSTATSGTYYDGKTLTTGHIVFEY